MRFYSLGKVLVFTRCLLRWSYGSFACTINCYVLFNSWYSFFSLLFALCSFCVEFPNFFSLKWLVQFVPTLTMKFFISVKTVRVTRGAQSPMISLQRKDFGAVVLTKLKLKLVSTFWPRKRMPQTEIGVGIESV